MNFILLKVLCSFIFFFNISIFYRSRCSGHRIQILPYPVAGPQKTPAKHRQKGKRGAAPLTAEEEALEGRN